MKGYHVGRFKLGKRVLLANFGVMVVLIIAVALVWGQNAGQSGSDSEWIENLRKMQEEQQVETRKKEEIHEEQLFDVNSFEREQAVLAKIRRLGLDKKNEQGSIVTSGKLGMNLSAVSFWGTAWAWADILTTAKWTDDRGWRKGEMFVDTKGRFPAGEYVCTWEGMAEIRFGGDGTIVSYEPGRIVVNVVPRKGLTIWVRSQPNDGLKNLKLWMPGTEKQTSPFFPLFVERLKPFGTIRFMDWQLINNSELTSWQNRPTLENQNQEGRGVALENMLALVNELGSDAWFCMPAKADDDFVRQFALMVKERLHPDGKVYVEYSNEIWNGVFKQHTYVMNKAKNKAAKEGIKWDWLDEWAWEMKRIFSIWEDVFKDEPGRFIRVIASQEMNPWISEQLCTKIGKGNFDALATTAYFGNSHERGPIPKVSEAEILPRAKAMIRAGVMYLNEKRGPARVKHGQVAKEYSVAYLTYEGGQHFTPGGNTATSVVGMAQQLPEMYEAYLLNMKLLSQAGGQLFSAYYFCGPVTNFGAWGHISYQNEPLLDAPKYRAMLDFYDVKYPEPVLSMP
ncbi:hypothetical protein KS4_16490 [Poriferisphaera corsica]|uniref:Cellulose-binding protein n=1 Tax=Poriferisphaera corsica TaxID=2528020 RepID=A0A517YTQ9_9BACT|nr:hypothetical protein [Poriferisphaera corsica]QDU33598.1 hypothetical protein KS4_16490 [Poriferisphaera corsica]